MCLGCSLPSVGLSPGNIGMIGTVFFIASSEIFRLEPNRTPIYVIPYAVTRFIFPEHSPTKKVRRLQPGILVRMFMLDVERDIQRQKRFKLIRHITIEISYLLFVP